jgi:hypothetical protein
MEASDPHVLRAVREGHVADGLEQADGVAVGHRLHRLVGLELAITSRLLLDARLLAVNGKVVSMTCGGCCLWGVGTCHYWPI